MTKLLCLHGRDSNGEKFVSSKTGLISALADEVIAINAPFPGPTPGRFQWFSTGASNTGQDIINNSKVMSEIRASADYIANKVDEIGCLPEDLIIFGGSQGGFMALYITLNKILRPKQTIAVVPFYANSLIIRNKMDKITPILWIAGGQDDQISADFGGTGGVWADLQAAGANLDYIMDSQSGHNANTWSAEFKNSIIKWNNGFKE